MRLFIPASLASGYPFTSKFPQMLCLKGVKRAVLSNALFTPFKFLGSSPIPLADASLLSDKKNDLERSVLRIIGPVVARVVYSLKLKAVPNLKLNHQQPLSKLLPVTRLTPYRYLHFSTIFDFLEVLK